jgi:hypothetical protein
MNYHHNLKQSISTTTLNWPIQEKPNEASFLLRRRYIKKCFINPSNGQIPPLEIWDLTVVQVHSPRNGYFSPSQHNMYIRQSSQSYKTHSALFTRRDQIIIAAQHIMLEVNNIPLDSIPIDLTQSQNQIQNTTAI